MTVPLLQPINKLFGHSPPCEIVYLVKEFPVLYGTKNFKVIFPRTYN